MNEESAIVPTQPADVRLGSLSVQPGEIIERATTVAKQLASVVDKCKLYSTISGKKFVKVEGWETLGAMLGLTARERSVTRLDDGGYEAAVDILRTSDGVVIGGASAIVSMDEKTWSSRPEYARRSMAVTRATGKAYRIALSWIMALAGYEPTPAEEMPDDMIEGNFRPAPAPAQHTPQAAPTSRPYPPETVRDAIAKKAAKHPSFVPNDGQRGLLRHALDLCFVGEDPAVVDDKRHILLRYLTGKPSTSDVSGPVFKAILEDWLKATKDTGGEYTIDEMAAAEAQMIVGAALIDDGQAVLGI